MRRHHSRHYFLHSSAHSSRPRRPPSFTSIPLLFFFLLVQYFIATVHGAYELDNALLGQPSISCHPDTIEMRFRTKHPFTGKIYVQGHFANPDCKVDFSEAGGADHDGRGGIRLHHGSCDMDRQRMIAQGGQAGMQFSTILVISFHPLFVTKTDRAFHINCMYKEEDKSVGADITVGDVTPANIQNDMPAPQCTYTIRKDELNGDVLKFARVGDLIVHRWECDGDQYGMLVHSCFVEDGQGEKVEVIDKRGCHMDQEVLGDPTYAEALNLAYRESNVFKFRDRLGVRFACEIKLCMKNENGCEGITPPDCSGAGGHRRGYQRDDPRHVNSIGINQTSAMSAHQQQQNNQGRIRRRVSLPSTPHAPAARGVRTVDADLISQYVFVLDEPVEGEEGGEEEGGSTRGEEPTIHRLRGLPIVARAKAPRGDSSSVCISSALFAGIVLIALASFGLASAVFAHILCRQRRCHSASAGRPLSSSASILSSPFPAIRSASGNYPPPQPPSMITMSHNTFFAQKR